MMEELRSRHKSLQSAAHHIALECIHPQSTHGSPYHVHPYPSPIRLQHAFQNTQQANGSPKMFHPKGLKTHIVNGEARLRCGSISDSRAYSTPSDSPILGRALCLTPKGSPVPGRVSHLSDKFHDSLTLTSDTDALVAKISAMFPTVSETHIKILLKKYYNREAVVISALQVEKHPITTPGPLSMSPCANRMQRTATAAMCAVQLARASSTHGSGHLTPLSGDTHGSPSLLRPASGASSYYYGTNRSVDGQPTRHQSPKMKLKYLKSIFPKAEEMVILDVLASKDNNVQKASEELLTMGFPKRETIVTNLPKKKENPQPPKKQVTIMKTSEEKEQLKQKLQATYSTVAERVITMALDSVGFNEDRAEQILSAVLQEDSAPKTKITEQDRRHGQMELAKRPILKTTARVEAKYKSHFSSQSQGPNATLRKGPKDSLLLEEYMTWNGPNPDLRTGAAHRPDGPEQRDPRPFTLARGPAALAKGPAGLSKGSIYQKLTKKSAKLAVI